MDDILVSFEISHLSVKNYDVCIKKEDIEKYANKKLANICMNEEA